MIIRFSSSKVFSSSMLLLLVAAAFATTTNVVTAAETTLVEPDVVVSSWMANTDGRTTDSSGYRPIKTEVGKKIRFEWPTSTSSGGEGEDGNGNNDDDDINVYIHQNLDCDPTNSILIGSTSPTDFVWTEEFANRQWLLTSHHSSGSSDDINTPCELGQFVLVQVYGPPKPTWTISNWAPPPDGQGFAPLDVVVGETIKWEWTTTTTTTIMKKNQLQLSNNNGGPFSSTTQTVFAHKGSQLDCFFKTEDNNNDITFVGPADIDTNPQSPMNSAWYTFTPEDGSRDGRTMWFTSTSDECFRGNILTVTVYSTQADLELAHRRPNNCRTGSGCRPTEDKDPTQQQQQSSSSSTDPRTDVSGKGESSSSSSSSNYSDLFPDTAASSSSSGSGSGGAGGSNNRPDKPNNGSDRDRDDTSSTESSTLPEDSGAASFPVGTTTGPAATTAGLIFTTIIMIAIVIV